MAKRAKQPNNHVHPRFVNTIMPYDFYVDIYLLGKVRTFKKRKCLRIGNLFIPMSRVLWSIHHPDETLLPTDDVHHKDWDKTNEHSDNLERVPHKTHMRMQRVEVKAREADIRKIREIVKASKGDMHSSLPRRGAGFFALRSL